MRDGYCRKVHQSHQWGWRRFKQDSGYNWEGDEVLADMITKRKVGIWAEQEV